jgi:hypothetical protein
MLGRIQVHGISQIIADVETHPVVEISHFIAPFEC